MNNSKIMDMIIDEFEKWKGAHPRATFKSMKVIMCTPRSVGYGIENIEATMKECYEMKKNEKYKDWIAGKWNHLAQSKAAMSLTHQVPKPNRNGTDASQALTLSAPSLKAANSDTKNSRPCSNTGSHVSVL